MTSLLLLADGTVLTAALMLLCCVCLSVNQSINQTVFRWSK